MPCDGCRGSERPGWVRLPFPVFTADHRGRPVVTLWMLCDDCIGGIASCCDGAGSQAPQPPGRS